VDGIRANQLKITPNGDRYEQHRYNRKMDEPINGTNRWTAISRKFHSKQSG
jgi:hypothetical protein